MGILEEIAKADPGEVPDNSVLLLKKFCAVVADQNLRWELKQQFRAAQMQAGVTSMLPRVKQSCKRIYTSVCIRGEDVG